MLLPHTPNVQEGDFFKSELSCYFAGYGDQFQDTTALQVLDVVIQFLRQDITNYY